MGVKFLLKIVVTLILLDFLVLVILEKYFRRGLLDVNFNVDIYQLEFSVRFVTWVFLAVFAALSLLAFILIRKIKK